MFEYTLDGLLKFSEYKKCISFKDEVHQMTGIRLKVDFSDSSPSLSFVSENDRTKFKDAYVEYFI